MFLDTLLMLETAYQNGYINNQEEPEYTIPLIVIGIICYRTLISIR